MVLKELILTVSTSDGHVVVLKELTFLQFLLLEGVVVLNFGQN